MALSDLHDDLLLRILHLAPAKEAASTTALARRWRSLWPSSGALNLDSFSYPSPAGHEDDKAVNHSFFIYSCYCRRYEHNSKEKAMRDAILRGAETALAASRAPITRLSFHLEGHTNQSVPQADSIYRVLDVVLSDPAAARHLEELRVTVSHESPSPSQLRRPNLRLGSQPFQSLRALDISTCHFQEDTPAPNLQVLPRLEAMRLCRCDVRPEDLQAIIDAAPVLATLQLYEVELIGPCKRIRCPTVTKLVLQDLHWRESPSCRGGMELHAPMLRSFRYRGFIRRFLLDPRTTTTIANVDLHFVGDNEHRQRHDEICRLFWQFVDNFSNTETLKLRLAHLEHIIVADKKRTAKRYTLGDTLFSNLRLLDLRAVYTLGRRAGGVAFATFLHCCPMIRQLHLELSNADGDPTKTASMRVQDILDEEGKRDLCESVDDFICHQIKAGGFL